MPLIYVKEEQAWKTVDLTDDEQKALVELGIESIVDSFGFEAAKKIMDTVGVKISIPPKETSFFDNRVKGVA